MTLASSNAKHDRTDEFGADLLHCARAGTAARDRATDHRVTGGTSVPRGHDYRPGLRSAALIVLLALPLVGGCASTMVAFDAGAIDDDPGERTFYQRLADESIETKAIVNLHAADDRYDQAHLVVQSYNGYVLIAGQVPSEDLRQMANEVVRRIRDVRRIYNELEVAAASSTMTRASDVWISSKVKTFLLATRNTPGMRTKVVAEDGVVYLLGMVTREEAERIANEAADVSGVQRVVRLFEYIDS